MSYLFLTQLSESKLLPTTASLLKHKPPQLAEWLLLNLCALRVLLAEEKTHGWAKAYARKTAHWGKFDLWRNDATDVYVLLHAFKGVEQGDRWSGYKLNHKYVLDWLRDAAQDESRATTMKRLFVRLDVDLKIHDETLKAVRRLAMDWAGLETPKKKLLATKLIHLFRAKMPKSELLPKLQELARAEDLELANDNPDIHENASAGATGAASVATSVGAVGPGGLGPGFDPSGDKGIYQDKPKKKPAILRR